MSYHSVGWQATDFAGAGRCASRRGVRHTSGETHERTAPSGRAPFAWVDGCAPVPGVTGSEVGAVKTMGFFGLPSTPRQYRRCGVERRRLSWSNSERIYAWLY